MDEKKSTTLAISLWLPISVIIDYACTFWFAGSTENLINNEYSVVLIQAIKHELVIPYILCIMALYFSCAYLALNTLQDYKIFPVAVYSVALIAIAHSFAGISWCIKSPLYTNMIFFFLAFAFALIIFCCAHTLIWKTPASTAQHS